MPSNEKGKDLAKYRRDDCNRSLNEFWLLMVAGADLAQQVAYGQSDTRRLDPCGFDRVHLMDSRTRRIARVDADVAEVVCMARGEDEAAGVVRRMRGAQ